MWRYTPLLYNYYERNTALMPPIMLFVVASLLGPARYEELTSLATP